MDSLAARRERKFVYLFWYLKGLQHSWKILHVSGVQYSNCCCPCFSLVPRLRICISNIPWILSRQVPAQWHGTCSWTNYRTMSLVSRLSLSFGLLYREGKGAQYYVADSTKYQLPQLVDYFFLSGSIRWMILAEPLIEGVPVHCRGIGLDDL